MKLKNPAVDREMMKGVTLDVTLEVKRQFHITVWLAAQLIKLAALILGAQVVIDTECLPKVE